MQKNKDWKYIYKYAQCLFQHFDTMVQSSVPGQT